MKKLKLNRETIIRSLSLYSTVVSGHIRMTDNEMLCVTMPCPTHRGELSCSSWLPNCGPTITGP